MQPERAVWFASLHAKQSGDPLPLPGFVPVDRVLAVPATLARGMHRDPLPNTSFGSQAALTLSITMTMSSCPVAESRAVSSPCLAELTGALLS
jgi:hypothetical protein